MCRIRGISIFGQPAGGHGERCIAQHVRERSVTDDGRKKIGALQHAGGHRKSAVAFPANDQPTGRGVASRNPTFRDRDEIVGHLLFGQPPGSLVPVFSELAAAAQGGKGIDTDAFNPEQARGIEAARDADVEAAITLKQERIEAIRSQVRAVQQRYGQRCAVLRGEEQFVGQLKIRRRHSTLAQKGTLLFQSTDRSAGS